jgi:hypothetical protein
VHLLALLCELFVNSRTWITLRHIFHCHISFHSVNNVNKIEAVLITYTYTLQNILQFNAPIQQIFPGIVLIYLQKRVGGHHHHYHHHHHNNNKSVEITCFCLTFICISEYMCCLHLNYLHVCDQIVSGLTARCHSCFQHKFLLLDINIVVCWIISCLE